MALEIGVVYKRGHQLFLAISDSILISYKRGEFVESPSSPSCLPARDTTVDDLCDSWGVSVDQIDEVMLSRMTPAAKKISRRRSTVQRSSIAEDDYWRRLRLSRIRE